MDEPDRPELLDHVLLPVASEENARTTAAALSRYDPNRITALYVIEKGSGGPAPTPVSKSGERGGEAFVAVREQFDDIEMETAFSDDIVGTIIEMATEVDASAIVFHPRGGSRLLQFLSGDKTLRLVTQSDRPVIAVPSPDDD